MPESLGSVLAAARRERGWSLRDAAAASGVANAHLSQLETGAIRAPGLAVLRQLSIAYGIPLRRLADAGARSEQLAADQDLLERAEDALHSIALDLLAVSPRLKEPYTDMPEASPWSMFTGPQARRAHDLAMEIRRHLGLPHRWRTRAAGTPPLEERDVAAAAIAAERARITEAAEAAAFTLFRPGNGPGIGQRLDVVPLADLRDLIGEPGA